MKTRTIALLILLISITITRTFSDLSRGECSNDLSLCVDFLETTVKPPESCCNPLKAVIAMRLTCLCEIHNKSDSLTLLGVNRTQALGLPRRCGLSGCSLTNGTSALGPAMPPPPPPATGNQGVNSSSVGGTFIRRSNGGKRNGVTSIVASTVGVFILVAALAIYFFCKMKWKKDGHGELEDNKSRAIPEVKNQQFTYSQLLEMTNNFQRVIGKGGFATVYHGYLNDTQVAVKMLNPSSLQVFKDLRSEVVMLMRIHHRNLLSLIGYCNEGEKLGLVYEYMSNGNLETYISSQNREYLTWEDRLYVAIDAAHGLDYLHSGCKPSIVHRDIKSANILLNEKFQAKLADFGLSRILQTDGESTTDVVTRVAGTPGYLDPEYFTSNLLNEKSDVFSFGVVLLELVSSQPVIAKTEDKTHIIKRFREILSTTGDISSLIDPRLQGEYEKNSVWKVAELAMTCVSSNSDVRPTMEEVVSQLTQCLIMEKARKNERCTSQTAVSMEMPWHIELGPVAR